MRFFRRLPNESTRVGLSRRALLGAAMKDWQRTLATESNRILLGASCEPFTLSNWTPGDCRIDSNLLEVSCLSGPLIQEHFVHHWGPSGHESLGPFEQLVKARRVYRCANVLVDMDTAVPWTDNGWILGDAHKYPERISLTKFSSRWHQRATSTLSGLVIVAAVPDNYFHFVIEELPSLLHLTSNYPNATVYISSASPTWAQRILSDFGINYRVTSSTTVRCDTYLVTTKLAGTPSSLEIDLLRGVIGRAIPSKPTPRSAKLSKILISRRSYGRASPLETALTSESEKLGLTVIDPGTLGILEQADIFSKANLILGSGGAALTNMVWMPPSGRVVILGDSREGFGYSPYVRLWSQLADVSGHTHEIWNDDLASASGFLGQVADRI